MKLLAMHNHIFQLPCGFWQSLLRVWRSFLLQTPRPACLTQRPACAYRHEIGTSLLALLWITWQNLVCEIDKVNTLFFFLLFLHLYEKKQLNPILITFIYFNVIMNKRMFSMKQVCMNKTPCKYICTFILFVHFIC